MQWQAKVLFAARPLHRSVGWLGTPALSARRQGAEREAGRAHGLREKTNLTTTVPGRGRGREVREDPEAEFSGHPETGEATNVGRAVGRSGGQGEGGQRAGTASALGAQPLGESGRQRADGAVPTQRRRPGGIVLPARQAAHSPAQEAASGVASSGRGAKPGAGPLRPDRLLRF